MLKKFVNDSASVVEEMLEGVVSAYPDTYVKVPRVNALAFTESRKNKVALVIGGGTGHEPLFLGFVGAGLADAVVCGRLYNAPDPVSIYDAAQAVESGCGVLLLYGNYPGDCLNFKSAEEALNRDGIVTRHICVSDDVASGPKSRKQDRRGISGDVFMIKIIGAACDAGLGIDEIVKLGEKVNENLWSIAAAITRRRMNTGLDRYDSGTSIDPLYIDYGIGLHGERGILSLKLQSVDALVDTMYSQLMSETEIRKKDEVCVIVNGMGSISVMELSIVFRRLKALLDSDGIRIYDVDINSYCSGYESYGFSISLLKVDETLKHYYGSPAHSRFYSHTLTKRRERWNNSRKASQVTRDLGELTLGETEKYEPAPPFVNPIHTLDVLRVRDMMLKVEEALEKSESYLNYLDSLCGDGDHGICIANGMRKSVPVLRRIREGSQPRDVFLAIARSMRLNAGGASGAFFGGMFFAAADALLEESEITTEGFCKMWESALNAIQKKGGAREGDKTLIDALAPAVRALRENREKDFLNALIAAEKAAEVGMNNTREMRAKFGRGKFLPDFAFGTQDAGATTIWLSFKTMRQYIQDGGSVTE